MMPAEKEMNKEIDRVERVENQIKEIKSDINLIAQSVADLAKAVTEKKSKKKKDEKES
jgi:Ni,Fe-hydrogenase III large subunit